MTNLPYRPFTRFNIIYLIRILRSASEPEAWAAEAGGDQRFATRLALVGTPPLNGTAAQGDGSGPCTSRIVDVATRRGQLCRELGRDRPDFVERLAQIHRLAAG